MIRDPCSGYNYENGLLFGVESSADACNGIIFIARHITHTLYFIIGNIQFPGLIISGGTDRRSTETFPAQISCAIPSFPDEGNLSIFILIFVFAIHFDPKS